MLPIGLPSTFGEFCVSTLAPRGAAQAVVEMEHARKMVLVEPRQVNSLRSTAPPPRPTDSLCKKVQALDDEMMVILENQKPRRQDQGNLV